MKKFFFLSLFVCLLPALAQDRLPLHEREGLGYLDRKVSMEDAARHFLLGNQRSKYAQQDFRRLDTYVDNMGQMHIRFQPMLNGLPVFGDHVILHADQTSGKVLDITGGIKVHPDFNDEPALDEKRASRMAIRELGITSYRVVSAPELAFVVDNKSRPTLAWTFKVAYETEEGPRLDQVFANAEDGSIAALHPKYYYGRNRKTYTANNTSSTPGTLIRDEGDGPIADSCANYAHDYAGDTYDYYSQVHGRDSYDNNGATMVSTVHYQSNLNNAYWTGSQMLYGDGDGTTFTCLAGSRDVVAHELTHAVTERTANLVYQNESGALNEAMSDILGVATDAWKAGGVSSATWLLGEDVYTPGTPGDALRYMNNPTQDGQSYDYYPERYTGSGDYGGVHLNSGIANLAFYLLVEGGTHPRGKTSTNVTAIGIDDAAKIFYRALTVYMSQNTTFAEAAEDTIQAATDLFGANSTQATQMANAWDAVGVAVPTPPQTINNGDSITFNQSTSKAWRYFILSIPAGATNLSVTTSGSNGDADLYTRMGSKPTTSNFLCRSYTSSSNETCTDASPAAGDLYIGVYAYSTFTNLTLNVSYSGGGSNQAPTAGFTSSTNNLTASFTDTSSDSDGSIASRSWNFGDGGSSTATNPSHTYSAAGTYTVTLTVTDNDGATDSTSSNVTVTAPANQAPNAGFSVSTSDLTATFTDSSSDADGSVVSWSWNFGDGSSSSNQNATHTYASAGSYTVTLTVTDNDGATDSSSQSVTVTSTSGNELSNGQTVSGLSGATGSWEYFTITLPAGSTNLSISTSGGSGDLDLYTRLGSQPTTSAYDCRPYSGGNTENCSEASPGAGVWHIGLRGYSAYSGASLSVSWTEPGSCDPNGSGSQSNISVSQGSWQHYTITIPSCSTSATVSISGGSGDADLYVRMGAQPTLSTYDCRPWLNGNNETCSNIDVTGGGTLHISVYGYSTASGVNLSVTYQ